jgi:hypothetical protein
MKERLPSRFSIFGADCSPDNAVQCGCLWRSVRLEIIWVAALNELFDPSNNIIQRMDFLELFYGRDIIYRYA